MVTIPEYCSQHQKGMCQKCKQEYEDMVRRLPLDPKDSIKIYSHADSFIRGYVRTGNEEKSGVTYALIAISIFVLLVKVFADAQSCKY